MNKSDIERLRSLPIESVAERLGLRVTRHKSLCPFHDDHHASLTFNQRRNAYRCFACDAHGGTIDLVMNVLHKDFREACQWLAAGTCASLDTTHTPPAEQPPKPFDAARYAPFFERPWLSAQARRFLFDERRLNPAVVRWCHLTSWTDRHATHWLQIPYYDTQGNLIGLQNRNLDYRKTTAAPTAAAPAASRPTPLSPLSPATPLPRAEPAPRFRFPYGARCSIYNLPVLALLRPGDPLYITEGASDCWAMLSAGHKAVAIPSATLLSRADARLLQDLAAERHVTFHMYPDSDAPGERLFMQLSELLPHLEHHHLPPGCKDFADYYATRPPQ